MPNSVRSRIEEHQESFKSMPELVSIPPLTEKKQDIESSSEKIFKKQVDNAKNDVFDYIQNCDTKILLATLFAFIVFLCLMIWGIKSSCSVKNTSTCNNNNNTSQRFRSI